MQAILAWIVEFLLHFCLFLSTFVLFSPNLFAFEWVISPPTFLSFFYKFHRKLVDWTWIKMNYEYLGTHNEIIAYEFIHNFFSLSLTLFYFLSFSFARSIRYFQFSWLHCFRSNRNITFYWTFHNILLFTIDDPVAPTYQLLNNPNE